MYLPIRPHQAIAAPSHNVQVGIDKQLFAMRRDAELLQLHRKEDGVRERRCN